MYRILKWNILYAIDVFLSKIIKNNIYVKTFICCFKSTYRLNQCMLNILFSVLLEMINKNSNVPHFNKCNLC